MSRLVDEIRKDPSAIFEFAATLPSGNVMSGTIGPLIGGRLLCKIKFSVNPASDDDVATTRRMMEKVMGEPAAFASLSSNKQEREASLKLARAFLGGGQG